MSRKENLLGALRYFTCRALVFSLLLLVIGCTKYPAALKDLYGELKEGRVLRNTAVLEGRRIIIDPGHGGYFDGVVGADSLREADANLGVALYLWGLLKDAGAEVHLTRTTDRDFLPPGSTELEDDLERRMETANGYEPEVFISIHHNSVLPLDRKKNRIELYYKSSDTAGSLVLANDVAVHLARNLGIEDLDVRPGNYYVLRNSSAPLSILGEASYLSNPWVERKLKLSEKQKLEAQAYFLGLIDYFARGVPIVRKLHPAKDTVNSAPLLEFAVEEKGGVPVDPKTARVMVGRQTQAAMYLPGEKKIVFALPRKIPNGTYTVQASIMSTKRGCGRSAPFKLTISRPVKSIVKLKTEDVPGNGVKVGFRILDEIGLPVLDGTEVAIESNKENVKLAKASRDGFVYFILRNVTGQETFTVKAGELTDTFTVSKPQPKGGITFIVRDSMTSRSIAHPSITVLNDTTYTGDSEGKATVVISQSCNVIIGARGYNPRIISGQDIYPEKTNPFRVELEPIFGGTIKNKRISIDPAGAETASKNVGKNFLRERFVNLEVAKLLRDLLLLGGAKVSLTRSGEGMLSMQERISKVNRFHSSIAIRINHSGSKNTEHREFQILHYPGSKKGERLSLNLASAMNELYGGYDFKCTESARPFLLETHCPACEIFSAPVEDEFFEKLLLNPRFLKLEAEKILKGIVNFFSCDSISPLSCCEVHVTSNGLPLKGAVVTINQSFSESTNNEGVAKFHTLDEGTAVIFVETTDGKSGIFTAEITRGRQNRVTIKLE